MSKNLDLLRRFFKIREVAIKNSVKKLRKRSSKTRENFVSDPQLNMTKTFIEPAESCPY